MAAERPLNVLLLCNRPVRNADASTVTDHLDAFPRYSRHRFRDFQIACAYLRPVVKINRLL